MKITHTHSPISQYYSFKNRPENVNKLTGIDVLDKYKDIFEKVESNNKKRNVHLQNILYNAIFSLFGNGYYQNAKIFYNALRNNTDVSQEIDLNNIMGEIYKKQGDIESSEIKYKTAYDDMHIDYRHLSMEKLNVIKNCAEMSIILQKDISPYRIDELGESKSPYLNMYSSYLRSKINIANDKKQESLNNISMAYSLMEAKKLHDEDIILGMAMALSEDGNYVKSSEILNKNLKYLEDNQKIYSREFVENLLLLGINDYETRKVDDREIINVFKNSAEIAEKIHIQELAKIANYMIVKIQFLNKNKNFEKFAEDLLEKTNNMSYKINLNEMLGDYYSSKNKDKAIDFYNSSKSIAIENNANEAKIIALCEKIKKIAPEQTQTINKEIETLGSADLYNLKFLISILTKYYREENFNMLQESCEQVLNKSNDETNKKIARIYLNFVKIKNGYDLNRLINENSTILNSLIPNDEKSDNNLALNKFLFTANTIAANLLYDAERYSDASSYKNEADKYIHVYRNKLDILRHKVETTLMNYKAKDYYQAEKAGIEYLELLLDTKLPQQPSDITEEINEILNDKNDTEKRKIASVYETLGLINLKNKNIKDAERYFSTAVNIRERLFDRDLQLANSYAALARLAIINKNLFKGGISSKDMHQKALDILNNKYPDNKITTEERNFHKKYYGIGNISAGKYVKSLFYTNYKELIEKFKCYNKELSICE